MRLPFMLYVLAGVGTAVGGLLGSPRWPRLDAPWQGLGVVVPMALLTALVAGVMVAIDSSSTGRRIGRVALLSSSECVTIAWILWKLRLGF